MQFTLGDAERIGEILAAAARTEIMPRFQRLLDGQVRVKSSAFDIVTDADEAAERVIAQALRTAYPGALVVGEEAATADPALLQGLGEAELAFVIDPVDGTKNFASGLPLFGAMVAGLVRGEVALAAIHDPVCGDTAFALRGEGAWIEGERRPRVDLRVAAPVPVAAMDALLSTSYLPSPLREAVQGRLSSVGMYSSLRCAAHEYRLAASGHCHLLLYYRLLPWDHAPGWLLHREAGGYGARFDGSAYRADLFTGGLLCAPDRESWEAARAALLEA